MRRLVSQNVVPTMDSITASGYPHLQLQCGEKIFKIDYSSNMNCMRTKIIRIGG